VHAFIVTAPIVGSLYSYNLKNKVGNSIVARKSFYTSGSASSSIISNLSAASNDGKDNSDSSSWKISVNMPSGLTAFIKVEPLLSVESELVTVCYKVPFGLNIAPRKGLAVCTEAGPGGDWVNDVLRYTSSWSLGLPAGEGLLTTAAAFSGGLSWQCTMFNVMKAKAWEQVVEALTSNIASRTDEVVLIFEQPKGGTAPELED
jgi:hypothetical protein